MPNYAKIQGICIHNIAHTRKSTIADHKELKRWFGEAYFMEIGNRHFQFF